MNWKSLAASGIDHGSSSPIQKPGLGFPIARVGAIISLAAGAVVNLGFCRYAGKGQGEVSLLRRLWHILQPRDVLLGDSLTCNWASIAMLGARNVDLVSRLNKSKRSVDFRKGKRLSKDDHIVSWPKPSTIKAVNWQTYKSLPASVTVREVRVRVHQPGFRTKVLIVVTTLLDPKQTTKEELAALYRQRWHNELDLRSIKTRCKWMFCAAKHLSFVHKEIWTHILAYNLIRTIMSQAASRHNIEPRTISFEGALQTLETFQPLIDFCGHRGTQFRLQLYEQVLDAIVLHRVADRPDRFEPRYRKQKARRYKELRIPRREAKQAMVKGKKI